MADEIRSGEDPSGSDVFRRLETLLGQLRATATAPAEPQSWAKRAFGSSSSPKAQSDFNVALISALTQTLELLRANAAHEEGQEARLEKIAREMSEVRALSENLDAFRERSDRLEAELRAAAKNVKGLQERAAAFETELARAREEFSAEERKLGDETQQRIQEQGTEMRDRIQSLGDEMRERIQHLLDEQRVSIRQLSLQASEEAVLADRARRATELKLEELARRIPPPPA
jgi:gas vesicle protein